MRSRKAAELPLKDSYKCALALESNQKSTVSVGVLPRHYCSQNCSPVQNCWPAHPKYRDCSREQHDIGGGEVPESGSTVMCHAPAQKVQTPGKKDAPIWKCTCSQRRAQRCGATKVVATVFQKEEKAQASIVENIGTHIIDKVVRFWLALPS